MHRTCCSWIETTNFGPLLQVQLPDGCELHSAAGRQDSDMHRDYEEEITGDGDGLDCIDTRIYLLKTTPPTLLHKRWGVELADSNSGVAWLGLPISGGSGRACGRDTQADSWQSRGGEP